MKSYKFTEHFGIVELEDEYTLLIPISSIMKKIDNVYLEYAKNIYKLVSKMATIVLSMFW